MRRQAVRLRPPTHVRSGDGPPIMLLLQRPLEIGNGILKIIHPRHRHGGDGRRARDANPSEPVQRGHAGVVPGGGQDLQARLLEDGLVGGEGLADDGLTGERGAEVELRARVEPGVVEGAGGECAGDVGGIAQDGGLFGAEAAGDAHPVQVRAFAAVLEQDGVDGAADGDDGAGLAALVDVGGH